MRRLRTTLVALPLALALFAAPIAPTATAQESPTPSPSPAAAGGNGGNTSAIAINTKDGFDVFRVAFAIKKAMGDVVDNGNAAVAFASCTECQTVAVSIQVVLMMNDPSIVTPTNLAIAINQDCTLCETLAYAFQVILTTDGPVKFTHEGRKEITGIRKELLSMRHEELTITEILARLDMLMDRFFRVLMEEMIEKDRPQDAASTSPEPAPASSDEPSPSQQSSSPSPTPTPSSTPSDTPTPSPSP
jgi:putative peptide zinc metalloprotease protein